MATEIILWAAAAAILLASTIMLISRDWRVSLGALAAQYLIAFWLVIQHFPFIMGSAKLITGWIVVAVLGMTRLSLATAEENEAPIFMRGTAFRVVLMLIVGFVAASSATRVEDLIPGLGLQVIVGSLILIGAGLIHLGISSNILNTVLGLLTLLTGFETLYAAIETSILVAGLLALVNLGAGLVGAYLLIAGSSTNEIEEEQL